MRTTKAILVQEKQFNKRIMAEKNTTTFESIMQNLQNAVYAPVYILMGEESYYIDKIADYIADHA